MSNTLDHNFKNTPALDAGLGPDVTLTRASNGLVVDRHRGGAPIIFPPNAPRFPGTLSYANELLHTGDLSNVAWTKTNVTVAQDATDSDGNANSAWTLTDFNDVGPLPHIIEQITLPWAGRWLKRNHVVEVKAGTLRYAHFTWNKVGAFTDESGIFDTLTGEWSVPPTYVESNKSLDVMTTEALSDGWWRISSAGLCTGAYNENFAVGPSNGPTIAEATYQGDGTGTILVNRPMVSNISSHFKNDPYPYAESGAARGWGVRNVASQISRQVNSVLYGAIANGGLPDGGYNGYEWQILISDVNGGLEGHLARDPVTPEVTMRATDQGLAQAVRFHGTNSQQVLNDYLYYTAAGRVWTAHTFRMKVTDVLVRPNGAIARINKGFGTEYFNIYIDDVDDDGWVSYSWGPWEWFVSIEMGLGVAGADTGDFRIEHPHVLETNSPMKYVPNDGRDYGCYRDPNTGTEVQLPGLLIEREKTNLVPDSHDLGAASWVKSAGVINTNRASWPAVFSNEYNMPQLRRSQPDIGPVVLTADQPLTMVAGERYTISVAITFFNLFIHRIAILNNGAQDLTVDLRTGFGPFPGVTVVSTGADIVRVRTHVGLWWDWWVDITFDCDGVDTTGDLRFQVMTTDISDQIPTGASSDNTIGWGNAQVEQGDFSTHIPTSGGTATRSADVAKITDMSWFNASAGTFMVQFTVPDVTDLTVARCVLNAHNGGPPQRISIELGNGVNDFIRMQVHNVSQQVNIAGPSLTPGSICSVAIAYAANDYEMWVNGSLAGTSGSGSLPVGIAEMNIGSNAADLEQLDSTIGRIWYDDTRLPAADLAVLSTGRIPTGAQGLSRSLGRPVERIRDLSI